MSKTNKMYDKKFRTDLMSDPKKYIKELGDSLSDELDIVVKENTKSTTYVIIPFQSFDGDFLNQIQAAGDCFGTSGTLFSASTYGSVCGSMSTIGCAGSASTVGSLVGAP